MGPGYVVAALLEGAGLSGLVVAAFVMRTERMARVAELRTVLRTGQSSTAVVKPAVPRRWRMGAPRIVSVPVVMQPRGATRPRESAARSALGRAFVQAAPLPARGMAASISAG